MFHDCSVVCPICYSYYYYYHHFMALWNLSRTTWVSRYQNKHSPTHTCCGHQSLIICFLHLLWSMASSFLKLCAWQYFSTICLQVLFGLPLGLAPSTSYSIHFFIQSLCSFCSTCPCHCYLFCCSTKIMSYNPSLSLDPLLGTLFCSLMPHINLTILICPLKCHLIFLSYGPCLTSMQHTTSHTTAVQSPSHYQWYILIGKKWYQLPEFIPSNSNSGLNSFISISVYTQHVAEITKLIH